MENLTYKTLLLNEFRLISILNLNDNLDDKVNNELNNDNLIKAMTINENLLAFGYTLLPKDIITLSLSQSLDSFYNDFISIMDNMSVKAKPMYPDFPSTVLELDEAQFRFHQLMHYFSTYGMENLFGVEITHGWIPDSPETKKIENDETLLNAKIIECVVNEEQYFKPLVKMLHNKKRISGPQKQMLELLLNEVCKTDKNWNLFVETITENHTEFKENLFLLFGMVMDLKLETNKKEILCNLCQHTGDVLKCIGFYLTHHKYHLSRPQKRLVVEVLESYSEEDLKVNLILSNKKGEYNKKLLDYISYTQYSKSQSHLEVVRQFRNNELHSWESTMKQLLFSHDKNALKYIATRPGMLLRMLAWLIRLGYSQEELLKAFKNKEQQLSTATIVEILTNFGNTSFDDDQEKQIVYDICLNLLQSNLSAKNTGLKNKKIVLEEGNIDLAHSKINSKNVNMGGYIHPGLVFKIPNNINILRFFVYWNDEHRVDIDLHSYFQSKNDDNLHHVGWNGQFKQDGIIYSGDLTYSDAAEYIDIDMNNENLQYVVNKIDLFYGKEGFNKIKECYVGMQAVSKLNAYVQLYNPKNLFFQHDLTKDSQLSKSYSYCIIDVKNKLLYLNCDHNPVQEQIENRDTKFSIQQYLNILFKAQNVEVVSKENVDENSDVVYVSLEKNNHENGISIIDNNYWLN